MNIALQAKLLRFLQDGMIRRIGGMTEKRINVRILSNLNMPPYRAISEGLIRQDLFFRLGVVNINLPPLRERRGNISAAARKLNISRQNLQYRLKKEHIDVKDIKNGF